MGTVLLSLVLGCGMIEGLMGDDAPATAPKPAADAAAPKPAGDAAGLMRGGKYDAAVDLLLKKLASTPEDDASWDQLELAGRRSPNPGKLVDGLSADQALGGRAERHHAVRGAMALLAGRPEDTLISARALLAVAPGDAAALMAGAVMAGAAAPSDMPAEAGMLLAARGGSGPLAPEIEAIPGWRAASMRAELKLARGDRAGAASEADKMATGGAVAAHLAALWKVRTANGVAEASPVLEAAIKAASDAGDLGAVAPLLSASRDVWLSAWQADVLADLCKTQRTALKGQAAAAAVAAVEAEVALRAGRPLQAREAAAAMAEVDKSEAGLAEAAWWRGLASAALGDAVAVQAAAADTSGPSREALKMLAAAMRGEKVDVPAPGLTAERAALHASLVHLWREDAAGLANAVAAARRSGTAVPDLELLVTVSGRAPMTLPDSASPALKAENQAREWLSSRANVGAPSSDHPATGGWAAVMAAAPAASGIGVDAWARARAAVAAGDPALAAREYGTLGLAVPAWRQGPWRPLLVLDGPTLREVESDFTSLPAGFDDVTLAVATHGWAHRTNQSARLWSHGVLPYAPGTKPEVAEAVWSAAAAARYAELRWAAGQGAWPAEATAALTKAEAEVGLRVFQPPSLAALRQAMSGEAIFSLRAHSGGVELLQITESAGRIIQLDPGRVEAMRGYVNTLINGGIDVAAGDRLRQLLLDGSTDILLGIGRYVLVGDGDLSLTPLVALPEQVDGRRYLLAVRFLGFEPSFDTITAQPGDAFVDYKTDMLAFCVDEAEAKGLEATFPNARIFWGKAAKAEIWRAEATTARFVHLGNLPVSGDGAGYRLGDEVLSLADIGNTRLHAEVVFVGAPTPEVAASRSLVMRHAGATAIVGSAWTNRREVQEGFLASFWDTVSGRIATSRAVSEARAHAVGVKDVSVTPPSGWASFYFIGEP